MAEETELPRPKVRLTEEVIGLRPAVAWAREIGPAALLNVMTDYVNKKPSTAAAPAERGSMPGSSSDPGRAPPPQPPADVEMGGDGVRGIDLDIGPDGIPYGKAGALSTRELVENVWHDRGDLAADPGWAPWVSTEGTTSEGGCQRVES